MEHSDQSEVDDHRFFELFKEWEGKPIEVGVVTGNDLVVVDTLPFLAPLEETAEVYLVSEAVFIAGLMVGFDVFEFDFLGGVAHQQTTAILYKLIFQFHCLLIFQWFRLHRNRFMPNNSLVLPHCELFLIRPVLIGFIHL